MVRIEILNWSGKTLEVNDLSKSLLRHFQDNHLDWMHACGGKGRCTTCKVRVVTGSENFVPFTPAELRYKQIGALRDGERLACQVRIKGDISIKVPEEYKLPHIRYES